MSEVNYTPLLQKNRCKPVSPGTCKSHPLRNIAFPLFLINNKCMETSSLLLLSALSVAIVILMGIFLLYRYLKGSQKWSSENRTDLKNQGIFNIVCLLLLLYFLFTKRIELFIIFIGLCFISWALLFWNSEFTYFNYVPFKNKSISKFQKVIALGAGITIMLLGLLVVMGVIS